MRMRRWRGVVCALALFLILPGVAAGAAHAQDISIIGEAELGLAERTAVALDKTLDDIVKASSVPDLKGSALDKMRQKIEDLRQEAIKAKLGLAQPLRNLLRQNEEISAAAGDQESQQVTVKSKALGKKIGEFVAAEKQHSLVILRAEQLSQIVAGKQRQKFVSEVLEPGYSVLDPALWRETWPTVPELFARLGTLSSNWDVTAPGDTAIEKWRRERPRVAFVVASALLGVIVWITLAVRSRKFHFNAVSDLRRIWRAVRFTLLTMVSSFFLCVAVLVITDLAGPPPRIARLIEVGLQSFLITIFAIAMSWSVLRPYKSALRLVNIADFPALNLHYGVCAMAALYGLDRVIAELAAALFMPLSFIIGWTALSTAALGAVFAVVLIIAHRAASLHDDPSVLPHPRLFYFNWISNIRHVLWLLLFISLLGVIAGYIALIHFVMLHIISTAMILTALYLLHHLADVTVASSLREQGTAARFLRGVLRMGEPAIARLGLMISVAADLLLVLIGLPLVVFQWTLTWIEMKSWGAGIVEGFKIGDVTIEPMSLILGIGVLLVGFVFARLTSTWVERRVLARSSLDTGVRNSIQTGTRYILIIIAIGVALSVAKVNFSNLALVAGALSLGIGFGLQSIVNNFVSGLILLAERPIKVGDWVKVSGSEGTVRQINVRSTEIETFDRCTVFVPNSSLISQSVENWYHGSPMGRVRVQVGVSYDSDPGQVQDILLRCARDHSRVLFRPEPSALLVNFGPDALEFDLRVFIDDIAWVVYVASELRFAILKAFRDAGIAIPFPQRHLHLDGFDETTLAALACTGKVSPALQGKGTASS